MAFYQQLRAHVAQILALTHIAIALLAGCVCTARAETVAPADSSLQAKQEAVQAMPLDQLTPEAQQKLWPVISGASIYRRLPTETITCDRDMYLTLIRNPEIIVSIWHMMNVTDLTMTRTSPFVFDCDDKAGTTSQVELMYGTADMHIFYANTLYEGSMFARPVKGRVVLFLRSEYYTDEHGQPQVKSVMDAFIRIDHITAKLVARTMSPLVVRTADHNFVESFRFVSRVHQTAEENGPGLRDLAGKLEGITEPTRRTFADVATLVAHRATARTELAFARSQGGTAFTEDASQSPASVGAPDRDALESANALPHRPIQLRR